MRSPSNTTVLTALSASASGETSSSWDTTSCLHGCVTLTPARPRSCASRTSAPTSSGCAPSSSMSKRRYSQSKPSSRASRSCRAGLNEPWIPAPIRPTVYDRVSVAVCRVMYELVRYMPRAGRCDTFTMRVMGNAAAPERRRDADRTRQDILDVATREFADRGFAGGHVDDIAEQTRTTKRMIYYYFGSKEQLFVAVLERAYAEIRAAEQTIDVDHLDPIAAIRRLAELTFDHHEAHPYFTRLVAIENIHRAEHIAGREDFAGQNSLAIELIERILERGYRHAAFRREVDALDLHMMISAFCVFRMANRHTFGAIFGRDPADPKLRERHRQMLGDMVVDYLRG